MQEHFKMTDDEFISQLENCEMKSTVFSHEAHLRLAWIQIKKYGLKQAIVNIQNLLQAFVDHVGARDKYHKTLTIAAVYIVYHFIAKSKTDNFQEFIRDHQRLKTNFKDLINSHYSIDIIKSSKARKEYLEPDIIPFG